MEVTTSRSGSVSRNVWDRALHRFLGSFVQHGSLDLTYPDGTTHEYGSGKPSVAVSITDPEAIKALVLSPELGLGEAYTNASLKIRDDDLHRMFEVILANRQENAGWLLRANLALRNIRRRFERGNRPARARSNVAHHYDLDGGLYDLFLDKDRQYSCAYFPRAEMTLDAAQEAKKAHIARKLRLEQGQRVLDIGCGWGGMALTLARDFDVEVVGVTLSREQVAVASRRVAEAGLSDKVNIRLMDYRDVEGPFDRVVSVGMFEHVGPRHYSTFFRKVESLLGADGVALIHTIGTSAPPTPNSPWMAKYIFPGGYIPSMSEVFAPLEKAGLWCTDMEVWRLHYAYTLRHWFDRFSRHRDEAIALYDERFYRIWRYYLVASEMSFRAGRQAVYQLQLAKRAGAVPLTRQYLCA